VIYIISDIHGEYDKLKSLLDILNKDAQEYVFLGDYVDKGSKAKEVVEYLIELSRTKKCIFLMGDHEYAWQRYFNGEERFLDFLLAYGGIATLESYLGKKINGSEAKGVLQDKAVARSLLEGLMGFIARSQYYHELGDDFLCVHAGISPEKKDMSLKDQSEEDLVFIRDKFIKSEFLYAGRRIIFGHTARQDPYVDKYKIGIDTGAVYKEHGLGNLTALNITKNEFINHRGDIKRLKG
jgi:serine/threonine protein phosphatase 1